MENIKETIAKLEKGLDNPYITDDIKVKISEKIAELKAELEPKPAPIPEPIAVVETKVEPTLDDLTKRLGIVNKMAAKNPTLKARVKIIEKMIEKLKNKESYKWNLPKDGSEIKITMPKLGNLKEQEIVLKFNENKFVFDIYENGKKEGYITEKELIDNLNNNFYVLNSTENNVTENSNWYLPKDGSEITMYNTKNGNKYILKYDTINSIHNMFNLYLDGEYYGELEEKHIINFLNDKTLSFEPIKTPQNITETIGYKIVKTLGGFGDGSGDEKAILDSYSDIIPQLTRAASEPFDRVEVQKLIAKITGNPDVSSDLEILKKHRVLDLDVKNNKSESNKLYNIKQNIGKSKYVVNYHDGTKKHKDGSAFYDISIFKNKKDLEKFIKKLEREGYKEKYENGGEISANIASIRGLIKKAVDGKEDRTTVEKGNYRIDMVYDYGVLNLSFYYLDYNHPRFNPDVVHYANFTYENNKGTLELFDKDVYNKKGERVNIKPLIEKTIEALNELDYSVDEIIDENEEFGDGGEVSLILGGYEYQMISSPTMSYLKKSYKEELKNTDYAIIELPASHPDRKRGNKFGLFKKPKMAKGGSTWIQKATKQMDKKGTKGLFTERAEARGLTAVEFAKKVLANPNRYTKTIQKEAQFVKNTNPELFN